MKPFHYLNTRGRSDVETFSRNKSELASPTINQGQDQHEVLERPFRLAFDESDAQMRGGALVEILNIRSRWYDREIITLATAEQLGVRFSIRDDSLKRLLATLWLDALDDLVRTINDQCEREERKQRTLQELAGASLDAMINDPEQAMVFLGGEDPKLQRAAMTILSSTRNESFILRCQQLVESSPHVEVRIAAVRRLAAWYANTRSAQICGLLGNIVRDESGDVDVRYAAYCALFEINDVPVMDWPETKRALDSFSFPEDIDWEFVNSCAIVDHD